MKQSRVVQIVIIAANLVLAAVCLVAYGREDRVKPEFMFQASDFLYRESVQTDAFLRDIRAVDDRDGDITERIVIEKVTENRENSTVVVYYAVSDSAGNVAKISRAFPAVFDEPAHEEAAQTYAMAEPSAVGTLEKPETGERTDEGDSGENADRETDGEAGIRKEENSDQDNEDGAGAEDSEETLGDGQREEDEEETSTQDTADETQESQDETEDQGQSPAQEPAAGSGSGAPVLTLKKEEVTIEAGTTPPWTEIIETLRDDKDDYATLYYNLSISRFNRNQPGDYPVTLYTEDSDGNRSGTVSVIVHVKGNG